MTDQKFSLQRSRELLERRLSHDVCASCGKEWLDHFGESCIYPTDGRFFKSNIRAISDQLRAALAVIQKQREALKQADNVMTYFGSEPDRCEEPERDLWLDIRAALALFEE